MPVARVKATIVQGETFRVFWDRETIPYPVDWECGRWVKRGCGTPVPDADITAEDYTGCEGVLQARTSPESSTVLFELTTANDGGMVLDGKRMSLYMPDTQTSAFQPGRILPAWTTCIGYVDVIRSNGDVEPQYEILFTLKPWGSR